MTSPSRSINPMVDVVRAMIDSGHLTAADVQHLTEVAAQTGAGSAGAGVTLSEYVAQQLAALRHTKPSTHGTYNAPLLLLADGAHEICSCECEACTQPDNSPRGLPRGCPCRCGCEIDDDGRHHGQPVGRATTSGCTPECGSGACGARWTGVGHRALTAVTLTDLETAQHWTQVRAASVLRYRARRRSARGLSVSDHDGRGASENFVSACRWLLNRAVTEGLISRHAAMALKKPQRTDRTARALSESQLAELLHVAETTGFDPDGDRLCLLYFCQTAARFQGVLNSRYGYLDTTGSVIKINETKTKQIHTVAITPDLTSALHTHALQRGPRTPAPPDASPASRRTGLAALPETGPLLYRPTVNTFD
ncbi:MAG: phage integrase family protein [Sulfitobacter sp.]|nr:phage integrase family protein [Sulfitobacter sp.]